MQLQFQGGGVVLAKMLWCYGGIMRRRRCPWCVYGPPVAGRSAGGWPDDEQRTLPPPLSRPFRPAKIINYILGRRGRSCPKGKLLGSREFSFSVQLNTRCMTNGGQKTGKAKGSRENPLKFSIYRHRISSLVEDKDIHNSTDADTDRRARLIGSLSPPSKYLINRRFVHWALYNSSYHFAQKQNDLWLIEAINYVDRLGHVQQWK